MNRLITKILLFTIYPFILVGQENKTRTAYISKIPIVVETGLIISDSVFNLSKNKNLIRLEIITKKLKIEILNTDQSFDGIKFIAPSSLAKKIKGFEYCIISKNINIASWKYFALNDPKKNKKSNIIVDTTINNEESLSVLFRINEKDTVNIIEVKRKQFTPRVLYYLNEDFSNNTNKQNSSIFTNEKYTRINENEKIIYTYANKPIQIKLENKFPKWDSSISYKIKIRNKSGTWLKANNQIRIENLNESDEPIILSLRYFDSDNVINYNIIIRSYWYNTSLGRLKILITILILLLIIFYIASKYKIKSEKNKNQLLLVKLKVFQSQLNPHFLFKSLSSIQGLVNTNKRKEANYYLSSFSTLMRSVLNYSELESILLEEEIRLVTEYIKLEQLRYNFNFEIFIDNNLNISQIEIPPLLLQPSIENAIKHGISSSNYETMKLKIILEAHKNVLVIKICDNGIGLNHNIYKNKGFGIPLTNKRIEILNKIMKEKCIKFEITSSEEGTCSIFYFSNWLS